MATGVNNIVTAGFGLTPGSVKYVPTRGLIAAIIATGRSHDNTAFAPFRDNRVFVPFRDNRTPAKV